ncbi:MAG: hypothetical protein R2797_03520 [Gelidibacter sp.]
MAPIKQEEQMRDKLEKRVLQPSPESWATLSKRLDAEQKNKNKSLFWWFGIAASIIGIVFVTAMYFNNTSFENNTPTIVNSNDNVIQKEEIQKGEFKKEEVAVEDIKPVEHSPKETEQKSNAKTNLPKKSQLLNQIPQEQIVAQVQHSSSKTSTDKVSEIKTSELTFEEQKVKDVVAIIKDLKTNGKTVTDAEIDSLLKRAQKEILSNRLYNETTRTVDANVLLQDVEADLQQSFRSKVFEALQSGYESVKTAVAQRNN